MKKLFILLTVFLLTGCSSLGKVDTIPANQTEAYLNYQKEIKKEDIAFITEEHASYAIDVSIPENLVNFDSTVAVIRAQVGDINSAIINDNAVPLTPLSILDYEVLKGEVTEPISEVYVIGGIIDIAAYMEKLTAMEIEKMQLERIPVEARKTQYIEHRTDAYYDFKAGEEYVFVLYYQDGKYFVNTEGYGTFVVEENQVTGQNAFAGVRIKNVLTDNEMVLESN